MGANQMSRGIVILAGKTLPHAADRKHDRMKARYSSHLVNTFPRNPNRRSRVTI